MLYNYVINVIHYRFSANLQTDKKREPNNFHKQIVNIPDDDMKPYIPNFQYFLSDATTEGEDKYQTSIVIKCWYIVIKYRESLQNNAGQ